ncbi:putative GTP-binding protein YjiA [Sedimentisphaera cyanobacteriorum]|uniref:Putative GTP-binding protein YjiA n=1 Tax=Sedimentisphaera cyanobacteriorum TaxID=1940790 RepID=A0A1Q2HQT4_9BACT|nr:GTP-binding protein [Sedimentisphaera cyanobacteriorum]AQQ09819.1 putative GTP-binding protein YjiA [Sedimentisphaera cyanobacteriorum]
MAVSVYVLTGYLGAGKTTALNSILKSEQFRDKRISLIINEFGKIGVDGKLLENHSFPLYEINKGSVFCVCTKTDFIKTVTQIREQANTDILIIEATGIAESCDIESFMKEPIFKQGFEIKANVCLVDAANFTKIAPFLKPAVSQVQYADLINITKTDIADEDEIAAVEKLVRNYNPQARITLGTYGRGLAEDIIQTKRIERESAGISMTPPEDVIAVSFTPEGNVSREEFLSLLDKLKNQILRLKGYVNFDGQLEYIEVVCGKVFSRKEPSNKRPSLTVIAWKISREEIEQKFKNVLKI